MTLEEFVHSVETDSDPPAQLSGELRSLWLAKNDHWHQAHEIAQDIDTPLGSWIHALLHLIEGDVGNAGYWFRKAGKPAVAATPESIDGEWRVISAAALGDS